MRQMRNQTFELQEQLKYCSPLGSVLHGIRRTRIHTNGAKVGIQSIRKLEAAGINSMTALAQLQVEEMLEIGLRRDLAKQIHTYMRRRLM